MERRTDGARPGIDGFALDHCCLESAEAKIVLTQGQQRNVRAFSLARSAARHGARELAAETAHSQRDPLRDKIHEVGRGLSLADTQTGR